MNLIIRFGLIFLTFSMFLLGCVTDQQRPEENEQKKEGKKPYAPSRNHIPRN
jgi:hypothetical protein